MSEKRKIIDSHVHFMVKGTEMTPIRKKYVEENSEVKWQKLQEMSQYQRDQWSKAWGFPKPEPTKDTIEETVAQWLEDMDRKGVDKAVFVTAGDYATSNENMTKIVKMAPDRFIGYAFHDPFAPNAAELLEKAIVEQGLKGIKILGPALDGALDDPVLNPMWEVAEKHQIPVLFHFGIMGAAGGVAKHVNMSPMIIHDVAKKYPDVSFIVPHFGCGQTEDALMLAWVCPNVYIDTSGSNQWTRWVPYPLTVKDLLKKWYETIGPDRILFGTDGAWFPRGFVQKYYDQQMRACYELGFTDEEVDKIFGGNLERLIARVK